MMFGLVEIINRIGEGFCGMALLMLMQSGILVAVLYLIDLLIRKRAKAVFRYCLWMLVLVKLVLPPTLCLPTGIGYWWGIQSSEESFQGMSDSGGAAVHDAELSDERLAVSGEKLTHGDGRRLLSGDIQGTADRVCELGGQGTEPLAGAAARVEERLEVGGQEAEGKASESIVPITWRGLVFVGWLAGIAVLGAIVVQRFLFVKGLVAQSERANEGLGGVLRECMEMVGVKGGVELRVCGNMMSPAACGIFRKVILIPESILEKLTNDKLKAVLIHELAHIKRCDLEVNFLQTVLQVAYFYNPFVWLANAIIRCVREKAVDEMVLTKLGSEAGSYSNTLIDVAEIAFSRHSFSLRLVGVVESKKALSDRIRHILSRPMPKSAKVGFVGLIGIFIAAAVLLPMVKGEGNTGLGLFDSETLIKFEMEKNNGGSGNIEDTSFYFNDYKVSFRKGEKLVVFAELYQPGKPMQRLGCKIFDGSSKTQNMSVVLKSECLDEDRTSFVHDINVLMGGQTFKIDNLRVNAMDFVSNNEIGFFDRFSSDKICKISSKDTPEIKSLLFYLASPSGGTGLVSPRIWTATNQNVTWVGYNPYIIEVCMFPLSQLEELDVGVMWLAEEMQMPDGNILPADASKDDRRAIAADYYESLKSAVESEINNPTDYSNDEDKDERMAIYMEPDAPPAPVLERLCNATIRDSQQLVFHAVYPQTLWEVLTYEDKHKPKWYYRINGKDYLRGVSGSFATLKHSLTEAGIFPYGLKDKDVEFPAGDYSLAYVVKDTVWLKPIKKRVFCKEYVSEPIQFKILADGRFADMSGNVFPTEAERKAQEAEQGNYSNPVALSADSGRSEQIKYNSKYKISLDTGVSVELLGVAGISAESSQWWAADGEPIDSVYWEGRTLVQDEYPNSRQVVMRLNSDETDPDLKPNLQVSAKRHSVGDGPSRFGVFFVEQDGHTLEDHVGCVFSLHDDYPTVDVTATVGYGRWETLAEKIAKNKDVTSILTDAGTVIVNDPAEKDRKVTLTAVLIGGQLRMYRFVAVDTGGKVHNSSSVIAGSMKRDMDNGIVEHQQFKVEFGLPLDEIVRFELQTRKLQTITFRNVSLYPGEKSKVEIDYGIQPSDDRNLSTDGTGISKYSADGIIEKIAENERKIRDIELEMVCTMPGRDDWVFYEFGWGYDHGKEYFSGIMNSINRMQETVSDKYTLSYDGQLHYSLTERDGKANGSIEVENNTFGVYLGFSTLMGYRYAYGKGVPLSEVMKNAGSVSIHEGTENVDGSMCYVVDVVNYQNSGVPGKINNMRLWIDPKRDFRVLKQEYYYEYDVKDHYFKQLRWRISNVKLAEIDGVWVPIAGTREFFDTEIMPPVGISVLRFEKFSLKERLNKGVYKTVPDTGLGVRELSIDPDSIKLNKGVNKDVFIIDFPDSCEVYNAVTGGRYVVGDISEEEVEVEDWRLVDWVGQLSIDELINVFDENKGLSGSELKKKFAAISRLVQLSSAAVPAVSQKLVSTDRATVQSFMALILRAIGNPEAVPYLIDSLEMNLDSSDYGFGGSVKDKSLLELNYQQYQLNPLRNILGLGRPVREITAALEKLTGHSEGNEHFFAHDSEGNRLEAYTFTPEIVDRKKALAKEVAERWRLWWDENKERVLGDFAEGRVPMSEVVVEDDCEPSENPITGTGGILAFPDVAEVSFAIVPNIGVEKEPYLSTEEYQKYVDDLHKNGPFRGAMQGDDYQWSLVREDVTGLPEQVYQDKKYVLLCARQGYVLLPEMDGERSWGIKDVSADKDHMGNPCLALSFDEAGGEMMYELTNNNIENRLAINICYDGYGVCSAPVIKSSIRYSAIITGNFTQKEVEILAEKIKLGMPVYNTKEEKIMQAAKKFVEGQLVEVGPDEIVLNFLYCVCAGEDGKARWFAMDGSIFNEFVMEGNFGRMIDNCSDVEIVFKSVNGDRAIVVTSAVEANRVQIGQIVFYLKKVDGRWFIEDLDVGDEERVKSDIELYLDLV